MNQFRLKPIALVIASIWMLQGCATTGPNGEKRTIGETFKETFNSDDPCSDSKRNTGIAVGAVVGGVIAWVTGDRKSLLRVIGGSVVGAAAGALIGHELDNRQCEISKVQKKYDAAIQVTPLALPVEKKDSAAPSVKFNGKPVQLFANDDKQDVGLSVSIADKEGRAQFESNSDVIQPEARTMFLDIAKTYVAPEKAYEAEAKTKTEKEKAILKSSLDEAFKDRRVLLIGHTDDTGNSKHNAELSERRAKAIAKLFKEAGVPEDKIFYQGAGETMPIASNDTPEGRAKNRRVEIVDLSNEKAFEMYLSNRRPHTSLYRATDKPVVVAKNEAREEAADAKVKGDKPVNTVTPATKAPNKSTTAKPTTSAATKQSPMVTAFNGIDFGGQPFMNSGKPVDIGGVDTGKKSFSLISEAHADNGPILTCDLDRPRYTGAVKSLKSGAEYKTNEFLPGAYNTSWSGMINGNLVGVNHVAVLRDGASPVGNPEVVVYKNFKGVRGEQAAFKGTGEVNAYRGDKALLYRVFSDGPVKCLDVVIPAKSPNDASGSELLYNRGDVIYAAPYKAKLAR